MTNELFQNPLFNFTFFGGLIFVATGLFLFLFPPKKINSLYGYRTIRSMKCLENWVFAQKFSAREMMKLGAFLMLTSLLVFVTQFNNSINFIIGLSLITILVITLFVRVEIEIKEKFKK